MLIASCSSTAAIAPSFPTSPAPRAWRSVLSRRRCRSPRDWSPPQSPGQEAVIALNTAFMTDGALVRIADGAKLAKPLLLVFARASKQPSLVTTRNIVRVGAGASATLIEAYVTLPDGGGRPDQHAERGHGGRWCAIHAPEGDAGGQCRHPSRQLDDDAGRRGLLPRLPPDGLDRAGAQFAVRPVPGRGQQGRHLRRLPRPRQPSTSTPRWWSIMPCPNARAASCSRACSPIARAACSRAR